MVPPFHLHWESAPLDTPMVQWIKHNKVTKCIMYVCITTSCLLGPTAYMRYGVVTFFYSIPTKSPPLAVKYVYLVYLHA